MPGRIRKNAYSDPAIAAAFDNLAGIFKPPSGADVYGFARAAAEKAKASRLAELFDYAKKPAYDPLTAAPGYNNTTMDKLGVAAGLFNPNQSYYSVDQHNKTAVDTNAATNRTTIEKANIDNAGELARQFAKPVILSENQTARLPTQTATATGLPSMFGGQISVNQGETVRTAAGETIHGQQKPLNESEQKAKELAALRQNGTINDQTMKAIIFGNTPLDVVTGPAGPRNVMRPDAVNQEPVLAADKAPPKPVTVNYKLPDQQGKPGLAGNAVWDHAQNAYVDTATRQPLPQGAITYSATLTGDKNTSGLTPTTANNTASNHQAALITAHKKLAADFKNLLSNSPGIVGVPGMVRGVVQDVGALLDETTQAFGKLAPNAAITADQVRNLTTTITSKYDPNIQKAHLMASEMAYAWAQINNPSGEVSRQAYERALDALRGGALRNNQSALAGVQAFEEALERKLLSVNELRNPQPVTPGGAPPAAPGAVPAAPAVETWDRGPDGQLRKVQ